VQIINCIDENIRVELGKSTEAAGESSIQALDIATEDLATGKIDVLVTGPINKHNVQSDNSYSQDILNFSKPVWFYRCLMFMINDYFRIALLQVIFLFQRYRNTLQKILS